MTTKINIVVELDVNKLNDVKEFIGLDDYETTIQVLLNAKHSQYEDHLERQKMSVLRQENDRKLGKLFRIIQSEDRHWRDLTMNNFLAEFIERKDKVW